ncbi:hybrid sensor histidine kinase/response regulator [Sorangium atrum]|uniref:histidine kinase n=1 Tax=Sorangium atrum TaxID=2995308 RepID=A0ABT5BSE5_9BACT|nr:response regulator [Sorangium aterium]MDC0677086.1 response regulator [Sorangium aterium]
MEQHEPRSKVLVVDDNEQNRALAQATLEDDGYEVVLAVTGEEALEQFERHKPDCVLLDVRMPGMDGFAVCSRLRSLPEGASTPIVFLTALRDVDTFDSALRAGGDDFLTKPIRPSELLVRVQAALRLRRLGAELRDHVELVRQQRDALMRLQLQKERLTAFVVHDLKNPVSSMDLHAQFLLRDRALPEEARDSARHIRDQARALLRLIYNLLDISKSEEGRLAPERASVDLRALVLEVFAALDLRASSRSISLRETVEAPAVRADPDLLRRTIENLLENAIVHAPPGTAVTVSAVKRGAEVEIRVADAGPGIPAELREQVFDRFVQLGGDAPALHRAGRGLGLAFCKMAVEAHGGTIRIEDNAPGAVFCVRFPDDP